LPAWTRLRLCEAYGPWLFESARAHFSGRKSSYLNPARAGRCGRSSSARTVRRTTRKGAGPSAFARLLSPEWDSEPALAAECVRGMPAVFDPAKRPWIAPDAADAETLAAVIRRCPTGALHSRCQTASPSDLPFRRACSYRMAGRCCSRATSSWMGKGRPVLPSAAVASLRTSPTVTAAGRAGDGSTSRAARDNRRFHLRRSLACGVLAVERASQSCGTVGAGPITTRPSPMTSISVWGAQTAISADSRRRVRRSETNAAEPRIAGTHSAIAR
jgi:hypothetical protein